VDAAKEFSMRFSFVVRLLLLALTLLGIASAQTITANFGQRKLTARPIPAGLFGINLSDLQDPGTLGELQDAGITWTRKMAKIPQVYATQTPNWQPVDWYMQLVQQSGQHPLIVMDATPPWLEPSSKPCGSGNAERAAPSNISQWAQIAAAYVAHFDKNFPGAVKYYEIWNEPELPTSLCVSDGTDATRLKTYLAMYSAAAKAMRAQASKDGFTIKIGGPTISRFSLGSEWIGGLLSNSSTAPYVDFVSYHSYITGPTQISNGMNWSSLYSITQSSNQGELHYYQMMYKLVRAGKQPNPAGTPIFVTEYNDGWSFQQDCCRNDQTYGSLWNMTTLLDFLNSYYAGANAAPARLFYYAGSAPPYFCIAGTWNSTMNCDPTSLHLYPQFYAFQLMASSNYLGLNQGGHMASSVSSANTQSGLLATAFYTGAKDVVVIVNPTATAYSAVEVVAQNAGFSSATGTRYLLNSSNYQIASNSLTLTKISGGYSVYVKVPAHSTVAVAVAP
jgi:Glycosyl hydrolases family 39